MLYQRQTAIDFAKEEVNKEMPISETNEKGEPKTQEEKKKETYDRFKLIDEKIQKAPVHKYNTNVLVDNSIVVHESEDDKTKDE